MTDYARGLEGFADGVGEIDKNVRAEIRRLQGTRKRLARLAAGEHAWIMVAAQVPHLIDAVMAKKHEQLDDPDMVKLYGFLSGPLDWPADDPRIVEIVDILERLRMRAVEAGELGADAFDDQFVDLLDTAMVESAPGAKRLLAILEERGWTRVERVPAGRLHTDRVT